MKTCPDCHRAVPDDAAKCPHPGCGHAFGGSRTGVKRPPPPPTKVHLTGDAARGARSQTAAKRSSEPKAWRSPLLLLATILLTSGLTAALTAFWRSGGRTEEVASAKAIAPPAEPKAASKAVEAAAQQPPVAGKEDGAAEHEGAVLLPKVDVPPKKAADDEAQPRLGVAAEDPMPALPAGLAVAAEEPALPVDNTPLYAARTKPKTAEWLAEHGGTIESQQAVDDGLNWLARHQGTDGRWSADCLGTEPNSRCDPKASCQGTGKAYDAAQTGLALLAFQAAGHYYFNGEKYSGQVAKGLNYLVKQQASDGCIVSSQNAELVEEMHASMAALPAQAKAIMPAELKEIFSGGRAWTFMYEHAMGTFALCEACAVAISEGKEPDRRYRDAAQRAVSFIEKAQHNDGGWRYSMNPQEPSDSSVSGWVMLALKSARVAKVNVQPQTISSMMAFFAAHYADDRTYYQGAPPRQRPDGGTRITPYILYSDATTGVGMMAVAFFERKLNSPIVERGAAWLANKANSLAPPPPGAVGVEARFLNCDRRLASFDYYLWYNCTMAMFQVGGEPWKRWNEAVRDRVTSLQVQGEGCDRGSWPPKGDTYGDYGGRIYTTALAVLTLEVYYRFQRVAGQPEQEKFFEK